MYTEDQVAELEDKPYPPVLADYHPLPKTTAAELLVKWGSRDSPASGASNANPASASARDADSVDENPSSGRDESPRPRPHGRNVSRRVRRKVGRHISANFSQSANAIRISAILFSFSCASSKSRIIHYTMKVGPRLGAYLSELAIFQVYRDWRHWDNDEVIPLCTLCPRGDRRTMSD